MSQPAQVPPLPEVAQHSGQYKSMGVSSASVVVMPPATVCGHVAGGTTGGLAAAALAALVFVFLGEGFGFFAAEAAVAFS
jgi:hypothetical protein